MCHWRITWGIANAIVQTDEGALQQVECDVVVDALPGLEPSLSLLRAFLARGIHVVSANKVVMADEGLALAALAAHNGAQLSYLAAVGGSAPMKSSVHGSAVLDWSTVQSQYGSVTV